MTDNECILALQEISFGAESVFDAMRHLGRNAGLPEGLLCGSDSHARKWHACSIVEHVRWCTELAIICESSKACPEGLVEAAAFHDIGKVIAPQFTDEGPKYYGHAAYGADYLESNGLVSMRIVEAVRLHGFYRTESYPSDVDILVPYLDLCDELAKWSVRRFPLEGGEKQRRNRQMILSKIIDAGVPGQTVIELEARSESVEDRIIFCGAGG